MQRHGMFVICLAGLGSNAWLAATSAAAPAPFELREATIASTLAALDEGRVTCRDLVTAYLARIESLDQSTRLNAIVTINASALEQANALDAEFQRNHTLRPLQCVVVAVKDNYETQGLQTTAGSLAMKGFMPAQDAFMVSRLRAAGAIVIAKTNMAEWAFSPYKTESSIAGITRNPYALERVPAGSSGGTAAAVAANFALVGLGTDTGNSIRGPASHNDLVGIRPTMGLTSRTGIVPLFSTNDIGGPLTRSVADAAAILSVVAGYDPDDSITRLAPANAPPDYSKFLDKKGLKRARLGVFRQYIDAPTTDPEVKARMQAAIADLRAQGADIIDPVTVADYAQLTSRIWCGDFRAELDHYLAGRGATAPYRTLDQIVASGLYLPYIAQDLQDALKPPTSADDRRAPCDDVYHDPPKVAFRTALLAVMQAKHLDAIIYPTWSNAPRRIGDMESPAGDNSQILSPQTGFPAITVPMGFTHGTLPAGLTFLGTRFSEPKLISIAYAYEQATRHHRAPDGF